MLTCLLFVFQMPGFYENMPEIIIFNLNTTGLGSNAHILQLSAIFHKRVYNSYILPQRPIEPAASAINKFVCEDGRLYVKGIEKNTKTLYNAVNDFINFLTKCSSGRVVLVAHCAHNFHADRLLTVVKKVGLLEDFKKIVLGFADTLPIFQEIIPQESLTLQNLNDVCQTGYSSLHNSVVKCFALDKILGALDVSYEEVMGKVLHLQDFI